MDELSGNLADGTTDMAPEGAVSPAEELRKRRSTRIVQAVPLVVTGVDALGRPFMERTSTLVINCHGCRYQSKHYVLKNMWVTLEIPHPETGQPPRVIRGRVAWIQRPRTVRQLFQIALELEDPGNAWGIAFPPEDWFALKMQVQPLAHLEGAVSGEPSASAEHPAGEVHVSLAESDLPPAIGADLPAPDNLRVFPSPTSTTDASLQLARHMTRLIADAKQQLHAAARESAEHAVGAERRSAFDEWEKKFAAAQALIAEEVSDALRKIQEESETRSRSAHAAAGEALQTELPKWLAPQLEQLTRDLTARLSHEGIAQRGELTQQLANATERLQAICKQAEESAAHLQDEATRVEAEVAARAQAAAALLEDTARQKEAVAQAQQTQLSTAASEIQQQVSEGLASAQAGWQAQLTTQLETARVSWQATIEAALVGAQERAAGGLNNHAHTLLTQFQADTEKHAAALREAYGALAGAAEQRLAAAHQGINDHARSIDEALARASQTAEQLEQSSAHLDTVRDEALTGFQTQLDDVLSLHRNELHRRSESLFEELNHRIQTAFDESNRQALARFDEQIHALVQPHVASTQEAIHRLAGGRSLLDAAMTLQQDRIRASADEAFADSLAKFRENLGSVEQLVQESSYAITSRNLTELEAKAADVKHLTVEEFSKAAEWYEKKAQTHMQATADRLAEQAGDHLRDKAGELSSMFASELDHSSRSFVTHTHTQMEEVVQNSFERARALFADAADTTLAAFTDEIQRQARQELDGLNEEITRSAGDARRELETVRAEHSMYVTAQQEDFLRRFQERMQGVMDNGVTEAHGKIQASLGPLLHSWKSMTETHQAEMQAAHTQMSDQAARQYRDRLENVSNSWMVATVTTLDHQSRDVVAKIAASAEERLREACAQVFAGVGETLKQRLEQIAAGLGAPKPRQ